ncbi:MAG: VTT domain-containing protein [Acidimicrobiales bacterium]
MATRGANAAGRLVLAGAAVAMVLLAVFALAEALGGLPEPGDTLSVVTAVVGVALLAGDAVLPVASSAVMVLLGAVFGVAGGTVLSTAGAMGALALGAVIGRAGQRHLDRFVGPDRGRVESLVDRYGAVAVVVSRPVPLLAESVAIVAGAAGMPWPRLLAAGLAGTVPIALVYAVIGDKGGQGEGVAAAAIIIVLAIGSIAADRIRRRRRASRVAP